MTRKNKARVKYREGRTASTPCDAQRTEADTARVKGPATQRRPLLRKQSLTEGVACAASIKSPTPGQYFGAPVPHNVRGDATKARRPARHQRKEIPPFAPTRTDDEIIPLRSPWHRKLVRGDALLASRSPSTQEIPPYAPARTDDGSHTRNPRQYFGAPVPRCVTLA